MHSNETDKCCYNDSSNKEPESFDNLEEEWRKHPEPYDHLIVEAKSEAIEGHDFIKYPDCIDEHKLIEMEIQSIEESISSDTQKIIARIRGLIAKEVRLEKEKKKKRFRTVIRKRKGCTINRLNVSPKLVFLKNSHGKKIGSSTLMYVT